MTASPMLRHAGARRIFVASARPRPREMMPADQSQITALLQRWSNGDSEAFDRLIPIIYERLREVAHHRLRAAPAERSLNTTGLVHEAYLELIDSSGTVVENRNHFLAIASRVMRNVLVDHARSRTAEKRGGGAETVELNDAVWIDRVDLDAVSDLDAALHKLEHLDERQARIIEQRYFGGLSLEETADTFGVSLATIKRELRTARAWLASELRDCGDS
jgi:RNA polymerase sigma factor (TIGR02999 family)